MRRTAALRHHIGAVALLAAVAASCGGSSTDSSARVTDGDARSTDGSTTTDPLFVRSVDTTSDDPAASASQAPVVASPSSTTSTTTTTIPLVSDTGVPGIDSDDAFCRSWSEFAGSFRAIGLVSGIRDVDAGLRLEVIASQAVIDAVAGLGDHLPSELEPERDTLLAEFAGPFGRRATKANESLMAAGVGGDGIELLADAWLTTLADVGLDDPALDVIVPPGVDEATLDAAVADFAATTPAIADDPSLITSTQIPLTEAYTFANCPDAGTLAGNDDT